MLIFGLTLIVAAILGAACLVAFPDGLEYHLAHSTAGSWQVGFVPMLALLCFPCLLTMMEVASDFTEWKVWLAYYAIMGVLIWPMSRLYRIINRRITEKDEKEKETLG